MLKNLVVLAALYASAALGASKPADILGRIAGKEISDLVDSGAYKIAPQGKVLQVSPVPDADGRKRHFQVEKYTAKADGLSFLVFATFLDEEDGGNSFGWVQTVDGQLVASVSDSFFEAIKEEDDSHLQPLGGTPRAISPALDLEAATPRNAFLTKLVEEFENRKVGPDLKVSFEPGDNPCKVATDKKTATCRIDYDQDRFLGTLKAVVSLNKQGKAVKLDKALFGGNF